MAWKVKNEMPIGRTICTIGSGEPSPTESSTAFVSSTKKPRYLKVQSSPRSNTIAATSARLRACFDGARAMTWAANVLTTLEAISSRTQRQSTHP